MVLPMFGFEQTQLQKNIGPYKFVNSLFSKNDYDVDFLDIAYPKDVQDILLKFQNTMKENKEWFQDYMSKNYKAGEGIPYDEKFGITKEEYLKIKDIQNSPPKLITKDTGTFSIYQTAEGISFTSNNKKTKFLQLLKIDLENNVLIYNDDTIPYSTEINAPTSNPLGEWHGYSWKKETTNLKETDAINMDKLVAKIIEINFGKIKATNKSFFRLKYKEVNMGQILGNVDVMLFMY
jgi:hypothetical protein